MQIVIESDDEGYEDDGEIFCTTCNGTGTIHGWCDDLCRSRGWDEHGADCENPRACFSCKGEGVIRLS